MLAFLAAREAGEYVRRDTLLGAFWPEQSQQAARRSLRQTLHFVRSRLGAEVFLTRGDEEVAVDPRVLECDVARFLGELRNGATADVMELYRGELLAGFYLTGATPSLEQWMDEQRARLRGLAARAATSLQLEAARAGDLGTAIAWGRRALQIAPDDETALRRLLELFERNGEPAAGLRVFEAFARRLTQELDYRPGKETTAIVERLRAAAPPAPPEPEPRQARDVVLAGPGVLAAAAGGWPRWLRVAAPAALTLVLLAAVAGAVILGGSGRRGPVLAVGAVRSDATALETATRILPELLATDLARVAGLPVIPHTRLEEIAGHLQSAGKPASAGDVSLAAGATDLIEGDVYRLGGDSLRLDLRLVGVRNGVVRQALTLVGVDAFALADSAAARFADRFGLTRPSRPLAAVTSASPQAQALYLEGLRAYYRDGDDAAAARLFGDALAADSTFAMAAYYLSLSQGLSDPQRAREALDLAARMSAHATPREALLIRVALGADRQDPAWPAGADSLAARYQDDPEIRVLAGRGHVVNGDFAGAVADFRAAIRLDSLSLEGVSARCLACDAYGALIGAQLAQDSVPSAVATARAWVDAQPRSPRAWNMYSRALERAEQLDGALAARAKVNELLGHTDAGLGVSRGYFAIRAGNMPQAESLLAGPAADPRDPQHTDAMWWMVVALRNAGRPSAAIPLAQQLARDSTGRTFNEGSLQPLPLGQVLFEAGQISEAARKFEGAGIHSPRFRAAYPGSAGRDRAWALAQLAAVAAAQRDTVMLGWLADSVAAQGSRSAFVRDRRLAFWVRGLKLGLTGQLAAAADALRRSIFSPTDGYTRENLELAKVLILLGRPAEAVRWLQAALRGGLDASNYYVTRTELQELAGEAFAALGQRDSAAAHYAWVARAWKNAEPGFRGRWLAARDYVQATSRRMALRR